MYYFKVIVHFAERASEEGSAVFTGGGDYWHPPKEASRFGQYASPLAFLCLEILIFSNNEYHKFLQVLSYNYFRWKGNPLLI